jgi:hypothetical protein
MSKKLKHVERARRLRKGFEAQSPLDGIMANVFNEIGGEKRLIEWADENYGTFIKMMVKLRPNVAPSSGHTGDIKISFNSNLVPTELDVVSEQ